MVQINGCARDGSAAFVDTSQCLGQPPQFGASNYAQLQLPQEHQAEQVRLSSIRSVLLPWKSSPHRQPTVPVSERPSPQAPCAHPAAPHPLFLTPANRLGGPSLRQSLSPH